MSFIAVIPARFASTRLPGKLLQEIAGRPMLAHVIDKAGASDADRVIVAADDQRIIDAVKDENCESCLTRTDHQSGSDRIAEVVEKFSIDDDVVIVNVQGDEPMIPPQLINQVAQALLDSPLYSSAAVMSTAAHAIDNDKELANPNVVKVVFDQHGKALYFSRAPIPYARNQRQTNAWKHIGIYAYRAAFLKRYHLLPASSMEQTESLEQLRVLENGETIMVKRINYDCGIGVDTQADLDAVRAIIET